MRVDYSSDIDLQYDSSFVILYLYLCIIRSAFFIIPDLSFIMFFLACRLRRGAVVDLLDWEEESVNLHRKEKDYHLFALVMKSIGLRDSKALTI